LGSLCLCVRCFTCTVHNIRSSSSSSSNSGRSAGVQKGHVWPTHLCSAAAACAEQLKQGCVACQHTWVVVSCVLTLLLCTEVHVVHDVSLSDVDMCVAAVEACWCVAAGAACAGH
jgi:hypothetical protein